MKRHYSIVEAARIKGVSRQAIHAAIVRGELIAQGEPKQTTVWKVDPKSLELFTPNENMKRSGRKKSIQSP